MITARNILDAVGREKAQAALFDEGKGKKSIDQAAWVGVFPSSWFDVMDKLCREAEIDCPRSLFSFKADVTPKLKEAS